MKMWNEKRRKKNIDVEVKIGCKLGDKNTDNEISRRAQNCPI